jgi:Domain of unknown function (DUF6431)
VAELHELRLSLSHFPRRRTRSNTTGPETAPRSFCGNAPFVNATRSSAMDAAASRPTMSITWIDIRRGRCPGCGTTFTFLPWFSLPYTHYSLTARCQALQRHFVEHSSWEGATPTPDPPIGSHMQTTLRVAWSSKYASNSETHQCLLSITSSGRLFDDRTEGRFYPYIGRSKVRLLLEVTTLQPAPKAIGCLLCNDCI